MNDVLSPLFEEIDVAIVEAKRLHATGPAIRIYHGHSPVGAICCCAGEEVCLSTVMHHTREFVVPLTAGPLLLLDFLGRTRWRPLTATQIVQGMASDQFTRQHARFAPNRGRRRYHISRPCVKTYVHRIRQALEIAFREAELDIDPMAVLTSTAVSNQALYRLHARVDWLHIRG